MQEKTDFRITESNAKVLKAINSCAISNNKDHERGSALVIAILILALISIFVAAALARSTTETMIVGNDTAQTRTFYAAQGSLEMMSRNFNKLFAVQLSPTDAQVQANVVNKTPDTFANFSNYTFTQTANQTTASQNVTLGPSSAFAGLFAFQDTWTFNSTATETSTGASVMLTRTLQNNRIPIFQFGAFSNGDLQNHPGPEFYMNGRMHANGNIYFKAGSKTVFNDPVTASGEIVRDVLRNGKCCNWDGHVIIKDPAGNDVELTAANSSYESGADPSTSGSVINGPRTPTPLDFNRNSDVPEGQVNDKWEDSKKRFGGNLEDHHPPLKLPLKIGTDAREIIKRGIPGEDTVTASARYYNKPGIRITLTDSQTQLSHSSGGVRLDATDASGSFGYKPLPMNGGYQATRMNAYRLYHGRSYTPSVVPGTINTSPINSRETWIKVELVDLSGNETDVTENFLSLGFTDSLKNRVEWLKSNSTSSDPDDSRSVIRLQRFVVPGPQISNSGPHSVSSSGGSFEPLYTTDGGINSYVISSDLSNHTAKNYTF